LDGAGNVATNDFELYGAFKCTMQYSMDVAYGARRQHLLLIKLSIAFQRFRRKIARTSEPLLEIFGNRYSRRIDRRLVHDFGEEPGQLTLCDLFLTPNSHVSGIALASVWIALAGFKFEPPRMLTATGDIAAHVALASCA
jgi:hypothetical protein